MGTRALVRFVDDELGEIGCLYSQFDGNPSWLGVEMARFIGADGKLVNGYDPTSQDAFLHQYNGMPDLMLQLVSHLKTWNHQMHVTPQGHYLPNMMEPRSYGPPRIGGYYLKPPNTQMEWVHWEYVIYGSADKDNGQIYMDILSKEFEEPSRYPDPTPFTWVGYLTDQTMEEILEKGHMGILS